MPNMTQMFLLCPLIYENHRQQTDRNALYWSRVPGLVHRR